MHQAVDVKHLVAGQPNSDLVAVICREGCGQVGHGGAAVVIMVDPDLTGLAGRQGGVAAAAGLDGGLLVGGDHIIVAANGLPSHVRS